MRTPESCILATMGNAIRIIEGTDVSTAVEELYANACTRPDAAVESLLRETLSREPDGPGREALKLQLENFRIAGETGLPICQDTGIPVVFIWLGASAAISGGTLQELVDRGISSAVERHGLRASQVAPPAGARVNTGNNTPAVLHIEHVPGDRLRISLLAKGAGCENVSRAALLSPSAGEAGVIALVRDCLLNGASKACPPLFLGIGIGGTLEGSGILSKKALLRRPGCRNPDSALSVLESRITREMNELGTGPQGFGGARTVLETRILQRPCHMASLPVTVSVECHVHRTASCVI